MDPHCSITVHPFSDFELRDSLCEVSTGTPGLVTSGLLYSRGCRLTNLLNSKLKLEKLGIYLFIFKMPNSRSTEVQAALPQCPLQDGSELINIFIKSKHFREINISLSARYVSVSGSLRVISLPLQNLIRLRLNLWVAMAIKFYMLAKLSVGAEHQSS